MSLERGPFVFRVNDNGAGPNLLIQVCMERGWRECSYNSATLKDNWNIWWKTSAFPVSQHKQLKAWQFTNHIPKGASICRKDNLARYLKCMKKVYGSIYDITPHGYNLPLEYTKLVADCGRHREQVAHHIWICKPVGQSQGRGIFLFRDLSELCYDSNAVVQKYIKNPLLIDGYKFDLRLYVCVPSYHPLTIYLYKEGIVRFSTDKFSLSDLNNPFCHLTNSSLNKLGPGYGDQKGGIGAGCKWSLRQLRQHLSGRGVRDWLLWQRIACLVTLTVLSQTTTIPPTTNCFEFYGFDVLIDDNLKPWLLEVNLSPALGNDCDVDPVVKKPLLHDLFDLLGLPVCNTGLNHFSPSPLSLPINSPKQVEKTGEWEGKDEDKGKSRSRAGTAAVVAGAGAGHIRPSTCATPASALMVATAATRWRRKHRKPGYLFGPPRRSSLDETDLRAIEDKSYQERKKNVSSESLTKYEKKNSINDYGKCDGTRGVDKCKPKPAKPHIIPNIKAGILSMDKAYANRGYRVRMPASFGNTMLSSNCMLWGNGRDWRCPTPDEGDWGRIYPLAAFEPLKEGAVPEGQVKTVVLNITRYLRQAKQVANSSPNSCDNELSTSLTASLGLTATVWLPPK